MEFLESIARSFLDQSLVIKAGIISASLMVLKVTLVVLRHNKTNDLLLYYFPFDFDESKKKGLNELKTKNQELNDPNSDLALGLKRIALFTWMHRFLALVNLSIFFYVIYCLRQS